jgi:hypothetical protein
MLREGNRGIVEMMGTGVGNQVRVPMVTSPARPRVGAGGTGKGVAEAEAGVEGEDVAEADVAEAEADAAADAVMAPLADGLRDDPGVYAVPQAVRRRTVAQHPAIPE